MDIRNISMRYHYCATGLLKQIRLFFESLQVVILKVLTTQYYVLHSVTFPTKYHGLIVCSAMRCIFYTFKILALLHISSTVNIQPKQGIQHKQFLTEISMSEDLQKNILLHVCVLIQMSVKNLRHNGSHSLRLVNERKKKKVPKQKHGGCQAIFPRGFTKF